MRAGGRRHRLRDKATQPLATLAYFGCAVFLRTTYARCGCRLFSTMTASLSLWVTALPDVQLGWCVRDGLCAMGWARSCASVCVSHRMGKPSTKARVRSMKFRNTCGCAPYRAQNLNGTLHYTCMRRQDLFRVLLVDLDLPHATSCPWPLVPTELRSGLRALRRAATTPSAFEDQNRRGGGGSRSPRLRAHRSCRAPRSRGSSPGSWGRVGVIWLWWTATSGFWQRTML